MPSPTVSTFAPASYEPVRPISSGLITRDPGIALLLGRHKYSDPARQRAFDAGDQWQGTKLYGSNEFAPPGSPVCAIERTYSDGRRIAMGGSERQLDMALGLGADAPQMEMPATFLVGFDSESVTHQWESTVFYHNSYLVSLESNPGLLNRVAHSQSMKVSTQGQPDRDYSLDGSQKAVLALQACLNGHHHQAAHYVRGVTRPSEPALAEAAPAPSTPPSDEKEPAEVDLDTVPAPASAPSPATNNRGVAGGPAGAVDLDSP